MHGLKNAHRSRELPPTGPGRVPRAGAHLRCRQGGAGVLFIGLQPHTHLEQYGFDQGLIKPGYSPMSMLPWTARQRLWNPEPMGSTFGRTVMDLLERDSGLAPLATATR